MASDDQLRKKGVIEGNIQVVVDVVNGGDGGKLWEGRGHGEVEDAQLGGWAIEMRFRG